MNTLSRINWGYHPQQDFSMIRYQFQFGRYGVRPVKSQEIFIFHSIGQRLILPLLL